MADWLEEFHEKVHPVGDPHGLWSGRAWMKDEDTLEMDLYLRIPVQTITITLAPDTPDKGADDDDPRAIPPEEA